MPRPVFDFDEEKHVYSLDGESFPSVTQIISATVPKQLAWWGMIVACDGIATLRKRGVDLTLEGRELVDLLTANKLTTNHQMHSGSRRGKELHNALSKYAETGTYSLGDFSKQAMPYARALMLWLMENDPEITESEVVTGSVAYRYAGTFDLKAKLRTGPYAGAYVLLDLKTGKRVYPDQHYPQLEAYEAAEVESGEEPTDFRAVLHLNELGKATLSKSVDTFDDFKVLLYHYRSIEQRKLRIKVNKLNEKNGATLELLDL